MTESHTPRPTNLFSNHDPLPQSRRRTSTDLHHVGAVRCVGLQIRGTDIGNDFQLGDLKRKVEGGKVWLLPREALCQEQREKIDFTERARQIVAEDAWAT